MTYGISSEAINIAPQEVKDAVYSCHCSNVMQCNHPSYMIDSDDVTLEKLVKNGTIVFRGGDPLTYGRCRVRVPGTAGTLSRYL